MVILEGRAAAVIITVTLTGSEEKGFERGSTEDEEMVSTSSRRYFEIGAAVWLSIGRKAYSSVERGGIVSICP